VTTNAELIDRVRLELGDQSTTFDITVVGNGTATRFETGTYPLDGASISITIAGTPLTTGAVVEERTGVITFDTAPAAGASVRFRGTKFRYFGSVDLQKFLDTAIAEHVHNRTDHYGRQMTIDNLPGVEVYPLALLATVSALWALATDASFDIDIQAPDGVSIPRSERYRQLMEMIGQRQEQYRDLCAALNIGLYRIEVFNLRRVSKQTGRLVPIYVEKEIENNLPPVRVFLPSNTLGGAPLPSNSSEVPLNIRQGNDFSVTLDFAYDITNYTIKVQSRLYAESHAVLQEWTVTKTNAATGVAVASLTGAQTDLLPQQSYWDVLVYPTTTPTATQTPIQGPVFTERVK
jgi:hypothetical protein